MEELDMLSTKEVNDIAKAISDMTKEIRMSGKEMKDALDMSGMNLSLNQYANKLKNDVTKQFDVLFGKQEKILSIEERRVEIIKEMGKAMRDGNKEQEESLKSLMRNFEQMQYVSEMSKSNSLEKAQGALSLAQGVLPYMGGASRAMNLGQGAMSFMGSSGGGLGTVAKYGIPLAIGAYGVSRMMSGYQTYKQQAGDVLSGYGKMGREGYGQLDNFGSTEGYSSLDRARLSLQLASGARSGAIGTDVGNTVRANIGMTESLSRTYGMDTSAVAQIVNQVEQIQGQGGSGASKMMAEAVASGVNRARISDFMERSLQLTEQVYQATGKRGAGMNELLAQVISNAGDKEYATRYTSQTIGQIGESIRSVGMGGGDLATQGFLSRAFRNNKGGQLGLYDQMKRAQEGGSARNIRSVVAQLDEEFENDQQKQMAMSQMFGTTFKQSESLMKGVRGGSVSDAEIKKQMDRFREESFVEKSPEGKLFKSISDATNMQAKIGEQMLPLATEMVNLQTSMDKGVLKIARAINDIMGFFGVEDSYEKEKRQDLEVASKASSVSLDFETKAKYGGTKEANALKAFQALEWQGDDKQATMSDLENVEGYGTDLLSQISGKRKNFGKILKGESAWGARNRQIADKEQIETMKGKVGSYVGRLQEQLSSPESTPEMQNKIVSILEKLSQSADKMGISIDTFTQKSSQEKSEFSPDTYIDGIIKASQAQMSSQTILMSTVKSK